jgi:hypothetical protein
MAKTTAEMVMKRILGGKDGLEGEVDECVQACLANERARLALYVPTVASLSGRAVAKPHAKRPGGRLG